MNIIEERIPVHKHFLVIDSPIPFTLIANNGTDTVYRMAGAWRIDMWQLLSKEYFKQYPVFTLVLSYDEDELPVGKTIIVRQSDIDLGSGIAGVNGQDVKVTNFSEISPLAIKNELDISDNKIPLDVNITNSFFLNQIFEFIMDYSSQKDKFIELMEKLSHYPNDNYYHIDLKNIEFLHFTDYVPDTPGIQEKDYVLVGDQLYYYKNPNFTYQLKGTLYQLKIKKDLKNVYFDFIDTSKSSREENLSLSQGLFVDYYSGNNLKLTF